jgi:predicted dehydrogenase
VDEALDDPAIDLIVVATPNDSHVEMARLALQAGKHVVVDKPIAGSAAEALELIALARKNGKVLAPFHNRRFDGDFLTVRKLVNEGRLGRVTLVDAHFDRFRPMQRAGTWKEAGGAANGLLFDLGPHLLDQALALFGVPTTITASVRQERDVTAIEDAWDVVLEFAGTGARGIRYECHASMLAADPAPRFRVQGTLGSYVKHGLDPQEAALLGGARPGVLGSAGAWLPEVESSWGTLTVAPDPAEPTKLHRSRVQTERGDYRQFYANVRDAILGEAKLMVTPQDGYRSIRLLELAVQSSDAGHTLSVEFAE